jgi:hypothetical protein
MKAFREGIMKKTLIAIFCLTFFTFSFSQEFAVDKGGVIIAGTASFASEGGDLFEIDGDRQTTFSIAPSFIYFLVPNIGLGGSVAYTSTSVGDNSYHTLGIGPSLGYFIGNAGSTSFPYLAAGFQYYTAGNGSSISGTDIVLGGGIIVPVKEHIGITIDVGYHMMSLKPEGADESTSGNIIAVGIGITGLLF